MIEFEKFKLKNGLTVIHHKDVSTPLVAMNILYNVGARDEDPDHTGFAHLFEHLMFGGSVNISDYDEPLERVGGENNAFTSNDITNYYLTLPKLNIETGFWLESDRMLSLAFSKKSLDVQRGVVVNEFKQSYLNQPYGDVWLLLRPLMFKVHPYRWPTIGKEVEHIEKTTLQDVKNFFKKFYCPSNANLVVAGNIELDEVKRLCEKWFEPIPGGEPYLRNLPQEPKQTEPRTLTVERDVPVSRIYKAYHMAARTEPDFYTTDLISDILSNGNSSRFYIELVKKQKLFSEVHAYHMEHVEKGMFIVCGKLLPGTDMQTAEDAIKVELDKITQTKVSAEELEKVQNKMESTLVFSEMSVLNKAMNLAFAEHLGHTAMVNEEVANYRKVSVDDVLRVSKELFDKNNCSTLYYLASKK